MNDALLPSLDTSTRILSRFIQIKWAITACSISLGDYINWMQRYMVLLY